MNTPLFNKQSFPLIAGLLGLSLSISLVAAPYSVFAAQKATEKRSPAKVVAKPIAPPPVVKHKVAPIAVTSYETVTPKELLASPEQYLNKTIAFEGVFNTFSSLGLDYKKAMRDSKDYVSFLIRRPDVEHHIIPLAELKLIYPRKKSEAVIHLEQGQKVQIKGKVFSTALNEPWVDVEEVKILTPPAVKKDKKECEQSEC